MREEWAAAGLGRRILFVLAALYWIGMAILLVLGVASARSPYATGAIVGFYVAPLLIAAVVRGVYVLLSRRRPRPPFWSWWLLVIGAALGLILTIQRTVTALT